MTSADFLNMKSSSLLFSCHRNVCLISVICELRLVQLLNSVQSIKLELAKLNRYDSMFDRM